MNLHRMLLTAALTFIVISKSTADDKDCAGVNGKGGSSATCGKVVSANDGDTMRVRYLFRGRYSVVKVRLDKIDAPESDQSHGPESRAALLSLAPVGSEVCVVGQAADVYGRRLGLVCLAGVDLNLRLVADGQAWCYKGRCSRAYKDAQERAKKARVGLWSEPNPLPPWTFRRLRSNGKV